MTRVSAWMYLFYGTEIIQSKFDEAKDGSFEVLAPDKRYVFVSSSKHLCELDTAPDTVLSLQAASKQMLQPQYTMHSFNWFDRRGTEGVGFVRALRTLLTNNIPQILPNLSILITSSLTDMLAEHPIVDGSRHSPVYHVIQKLVVLSNAVSFFGEDLAQNEAFMASALQYIEETILCAEILKLMPRVLTPDVSSGIFGNSVASCQNMYVLGVVGWIIFHIQQTFTRTRSVAPRLFTNRTSVTAFFLTLVSSFIVQAQLYFLPIYFQAVKGTTVLSSGTSFLPFAIGTLTFAVLGGSLLSIFGEYIPIHAGSFALSALACGLFTLLDADTSTAVWTVLQLLATAGAGLIMPALLPAIMAALPESDVAASTAAYSFMRTFGYVWGVTIASVIFNAVIDDNTHRISDPGLRSEVSGAGAYAFASRAHGVIEDAGGREQAGWDEVADVYTRALDVVWWVSLGVSVVGMVAVVFERRLELRKELETEYGIEGASGSAVVKSKSGAEANVSTGEVRVEVEGGKIEGR
ncbi:major facilitator superfamily domain-containing protein [Aspergillus pseudodeflectus]|uniref:Major facilitator superfamily domain-containing protein n=1 Tax=Aspergillus pseudodeflectus TaxID=176178 RepID=A0ABR4JPI4_9EURO